MKHTGFQNKTGYQWVCVFQEAWYTDYMILRRGWEKKIIITNENDAKEWGWALSYNK